MGQLFIEGSAVDGSGPIQLGMGLAGGQEAQATHVTSLEASGEITGSTVNGKTLSGAGISCYSAEQDSRNSPYNKSSVRDDDRFSVSCPEGEVLLDCSCLSNWSCDGSFIDHSTRTCTVQAGGSYTFIKARATCCTLSRPEDS